MEVLNRRAASATGRDARAPERGDVRTSPGEGNAADRSVPPLAASPAPVPLEHPLGLYLHIPFCVRKCHYCDFNSGPLGERARREYLQALRREILDSPWRDHPARTVFLGGGTPSELSTGEVEDLVAALDRSFRIVPQAEWSIECNPGTVDPASLRELRRLGFTRVSLGVQSFQDRHLARLGRIHDGGQARQALEWTRQAGFENVNLDLIFGLPDQTFEEWQRDLEAATALSPEHLSLYQLTIEADTEFGRLHDRGELPLPDDDLSARMYEWTLDHTGDRGYRQYEISNFARPGRECLHNWIYWRNQPYLGFGVSAASYLQGRRWSNTGDLGVYRRSAPGGGVTPAFEERLSPSQALGEEIMLALRTREGFSIPFLSHRYRLDVAALYAGALRFLEGEGLLLREAGWVPLTRRGKLLANDVCGAFLAES